MYLCEQSERFPHQSEISAKNKIFAHTKRRDEHNRVLAGRFVIYSSHFQFFSQKNNKYSRIVLAIKALNIDEKDKLQIQLSDNLMTPIPLDMFVDVVKCFYKGSGFYINLVMQLALDDAKSMVTPDVSENSQNKLKKRNISKRNSIQNLEKYLIEKNAGNIFVESKALGPDEHLSTKSRCQLVAHLVDFMHQVYEKKISNEIKVATAKASITLFPSLKFAGTTDGIVSFCNILNDLYLIFFKYLKRFRSKQDLLYNTTNGGYIGQRMKTQRSAPKKSPSFGAFSDSSDNSYSESSADSSADEMNSGEISSDDMTAKECFEDLKSMVVNDKTRSEIEQKLKLSREYRNSILAIKETDLLECFPYFFADPKLVIHTIDSFQ